VSVSCCDEVFKLRPKACLVSIFYLLAAAKTISLTFTVREHMIAYASGMAQVSAFSSALHLKTFLDLSLPSRRSTSRLSLATLPLSIHALTSRLSELPLLLNLCANGTSCEQRDEGTNPPRFTTYSLQFSCADTSADTRCRILAPATSNLLARSVRSGTRRNLCLPRRTPS
jgi:hypothetical protein